MIRTNSRGVAIQSSTHEILIELATIVHGINEILTEEYGEEVAMKMIADMGKIGYNYDLPEDELAELIGSLTDDFELLKGE